MYEPGCSSSVPSRGRCPNPENTPRGSPVPWEDLPTRGCGSAVYLFLTRPFEKLGRSRSARPSQRTPATSVPAATPPSVPTPVALPPPPPTSAYRVRSSSSVALPLPSSADQVQSSPLVALPLLSSVNQVQSSPPVPVALSPPTSAGQVQSSTDTPQIAPVSVSSILVGLSPVPSPDPNQLPLIRRVPTSEL